MENRDTKIFSYTVFYEPAPGGGYVAFVPALPACYIQGETLEQTERNVKEAIAVYVESLAAHRDVVPSEGLSEGAMSFLQGCPCCRIKPREERLRSKAR